jgi:hypothetical protein
MKTEINKIVDYFKKAIWVCFGFFCLPWAVLFTAVLSENIFRGSILDQLFELIISKELFRVLGMISIKFQIIAIFLIIFNLIMFYSKRVAKIPDFFYFLYLLFIPFHIVFIYVLFVDTGPSHPGYTYKNIKNNLSFCIQYKSFCEEVPNGNANWKWITKERNSSLYYLK